MLQNDSQRFVDTCKRCQIKYNNTKWELHEFPTSPCLFAIKYINGMERGKKLISKRYKDRLGDDIEPCPYYVLDKEYNYCFWMWLADTKNQIPHTLEYISLLNGTSCINTWILEVMTLVNIAKKFKISGLVESFEAIREELMESYNKISKRKENVRTKAKLRNKMISVMTDEIVEYQTKLWELIIDSGNKLLSVLSRYDNKSSVNEDHNRFSI